VLASAVATLSCAGCGSSSHPIAHTPVSLQELHGNALVGVNYAVQVAADGRLSVQRIAITVHRTSTYSVLTVTRSAGHGRLSAAERAQLNVVLRPVNVGQVRAAGVRGSCSGPPIGDVGGVALVVGSARTDCPPAPAQPLVSWLERLAVATPEKITERYGRRTTIAP
jgi:hypothetical protein